MKRALLLIALLATPAFAEPAIGDEASIPFVNHPRVIRTFEAVSDDVIYLQSGRNWYRAELAGPCFGLRWANVIGYDTHGGSSLDRFGSIIVGNQDCRILSLKLSEPPPRRHGKRKKAG